MANEPTDSIQIYINSKHADVIIDATNSNCIYYLPYIKASTGHYIHLSLVNATIPYSFYNINQSNSILQYIQKDPITLAIISSVYIYIPYGNYNANQMVTWLNTNIPSLKTTYSTISNKFYMINTLGNIFLFNIAGGNCFEPLGLSATNQQANTSIVNELYSPNAINLATIRCINIVTNYNSGNVSILEENNFTTLASVPVVAQPNSLIFYENTNNFRSNLFIGEFNNISIRLTDQDGNKLDFNGQFYNMTLQIDILQFS
ncbi:hypothetical protein EB001_07910 [bacterium]|nr:hypothetical protein [bacterium]